jgi:non-heme chloroperoxidase
MSESEMQAELERLRAEVAGLIYIEAGYPYALYDQANGELELDAIELRNQLHQFIEGYSLEPVKDYDGLIANLERVKREVKQQQQKTGKLLPSPVSPRMTPDLTAIMEGRERFTAIHAPALVIFADEDDPSPVSGDDPQARANALRKMLDNRNKEQQYAAFAQQVPLAQVVRIPHATHYVFQSNDSMSFAR